MDDALKHILVFKMSQSLQAILGGEKKMQVVVATLVNCHRQTDATQLNFADKNIIF